GMPTVTDLDAAFGTVIAGTVPLAGIFQVSPATCGMGVRPADSLGIFTVCVLPAEVSVIAESVEAPSASTPLSSSVVDWRSSSGIASVIATSRAGIFSPRSEEHTSELQSRENL